MFAILRRHDFNFLFFVINIFFLIFILTKKNDFVSVLKSFTEPKECVSYMPCKVSSETKQLSSSLNDALMQVGKLTCESSNIAVSSRGGWCSNISGKNSTKHAFDLSLAKELSSFFKDKRVASFGDGPGKYKAYISKLGEVKVYDAFDGAPYAEDTTNGDVKHLDLSVPIYHLPLYDWIISLEVAEHIPKEFEQTFIDNLTRHAKEGIILSWSVVGQGGHSHVNNQNLDYVKAQLDKRGFVLDMQLSLRIQNACTFGWLKRNTHVYLRAAPL